MQADNRVHRNYIGVRLMGLFALFFAAFPTHAQKMNSTYQEYIRKYASECIRQMQAHNIPASITMAQGLLESGAGQSTLASIHNNHFGIKCHRTWQGKRTYKDDDEENECFRSYESDLDSFRDHSYFLKQPRYEGLYTLRRNDYIGWAKGLQRAGYATDKGYANKLIALIELYALYELDEENYPHWMDGTPSQSKKKNRGSKTPMVKHEGFISYGLLYVIAQDGDSYYSIAEEMDIKPKTLAEYNDVPLDFPLQAGDVVYLQKKNKQATEQYLDHVVSIGESMHSIAQKYGIRVAYLYKMNDLDPETYVPEEGDILILRNSR